MADRGLIFTVPEIDVLADFHGDLTDPKLVLFFGGNYFFATKDLVLAFEAAHPQFKGRIFWETIPPGRLIEQIEKGGRITVGNMTWTAKADVYFGGLKKVKENIDNGILVEPAVPASPTTSPSWYPKAIPITLRAWLTWAKRAFGWRCRTPHTRAFGARSKRRWPMRAVMR